MASYEELYGLFEGSSALRNKITVAVVVAAETIRNEDVGTPNHANRLIWSALAFQNPKGESARMMKAVIASNKDSTIEQITGASDSAIQSKIDTVVDLFATGA